MDNYLRDAYGESRFKWVEFQVPSNRGNECVPGVLAEVRGTVGCVSRHLLIRAEVLAVFLSKFMLEKLKVCVLF